MGAKTGLYALQNTTIGRKDEAGPRGKGWNDTGKGYTADTTGPHAVAFPLDSQATNHDGKTKDYGKNIGRGNGLGVGQDGDPTPTLACRGIHAVGNKPTDREMVVRRLTPLECERLQGFPDGHTEIGIDEDGNEIAVLDGQRYKQMGNAVTVNVIEWIGRRLAPFTREENE